MFRSTAARTLRAGTLIAALSLFATATAAQTQQPSAGALQLARSVVVASGATQAFDGVVPSILQQSLNVFVQQNPDLQKELVESIQALAPGFEKRSSEIIDIIASVYAARFTEAELKQLYAFYDSEVGRKFVALLPSVLEEGFVRTQEWGARISEEVVVSLRAEMKKRGHAI